MDNIDTNVQGNEPTLTPATEPVVTQTTQDPDSATSRYAQYYSDDPPASPSPTGFDPTELVGTIQSLQQEVAQLRQSSQKLTPEDRKGFIDLLKEGKVQEAEDYLTNKASQASQAQLEQRIQSLQEEMSSRANFERRVSTFVEDLKRGNPDLLPFEELITTKASAKLDSALKSGRIRTQDQLFEAYQLAVQGEVEAAKRLIQTIRGAGKQEALTTRQTVLAASPGRSNSVTSNGETIPAGEQKPMTTADYLALRSNRQLLQKRLAGVL
jgi:hypothetical protein